ncbi:MAG: type II secretion system F family protein [Mycobacterium sp.]
MNSIAALALCAALLMTPPHRLTRRWALDRPGGARMSGAVAALALAGLALIQPTAGLAAAILVTTVWVRRRRRLGTVRRRSEGKSLSAALELLAGELRAGAHPARALAVVGAEAVGAVAVAFRAVASRCELGGDVIGGLISISETSVVPGHWGRLATYWGLAVQHGLPISALIRAAQDDLVERERFSERVDASLAGARATAAILAVLPVFGVALGELFGAGPIELLFGTGAGGWLLVAGVILACGGLLWSDRITDRLSG